MSEDLNLRDVTTLSRLLKEHEGFFVVTHQRKLIYTGHAPEVSEELKNIGARLYEDPDGLVVELSPIRERYTIIFYNWIDQDIDSSSLTRSIVLLTLTGAFLILEQGVLQQSSGDHGLETEINNLFRYYKLCTFLESDTFCDHYNTIREEYVFYSSSQGVIRIHYTTVAPRIKIADYSNGLDSLIGLLGDHHYKIYFVNSLFQIAQGKPVIELADLLAIADHLVAIIRRDYELALKQFDFEKFKDRLLKEKEKYFASIREILSKVFSQLIGIPISISATAFATYRVQHETITLVMILVGFLFYIIYYVKIQSIYRKDILDLQVDFEKDFEIIKTKSGLPADIIEQENNKVRRKLTQTKSMITFLICGILVLGVHLAITLLIRF
jgi:hypothetical protein